MAERILLSGTHVEKGRAFRYFHEDEVGYGTIESAESLTLRDVGTDEESGFIDLVHIGFTDIDKSYGLRLEPDVNVVGYISDDTLARQMIEHGIVGLRETGRI